MTAPHPTGRLQHAPDGQGRDLVLTRTLPGSIRDAWRSITEPELTAKWFGRWEGTGAPGETIKLQMGFEESSDWMDITIAECEAPHRLRVVSVDENGRWDLSLELSEAGAEAGKPTELRFTMHGIDPAAVGDIGPGWEYYLDQLVSSVTDAPMPNWDDYYPAQREYFEALLR